MLPRVGSSKWRLNALHRISSHVAVWKFTQTRDIQANTELFLSGE